MVIVEILFWTFALTSVYVYAGYPLLLAGLAMVRGRPLYRDESYKPIVSLIVSAFNEIEVIAEKLENSLSIDYPPERLEVLIVSDASDDGTDDIVTQYADRGVKLLRMSERGGKTVGLNAAAEAASGEILVFSDANAMYRPDAVRKLVRNFSDPEVGAAVGESTYAESSNEAEKVESAYWHYETVIKRLESLIGSVVGGDGAIYAIRREYYRPMSADALSDFVNPLQIVSQGRRCVYEPEAVSVEKAAGSFRKEFRRKVRIVNRAWRATMTMKPLMNPFRHGIFAIELVSHKVLRWLIPVLLIMLFTLNCLLLLQHPLYQVTFVVQLIIYGLAIAGHIRRDVSDIGPLTSIPYYFCLVNVASLMGIVEAYKGKTYTTWSTARVGNDR